MGNYHALLAKSPAFFAEQSGQAGNGFRPPPQWVLDRMAEETITGKYDVSPGNICGICFMAKSVTGGCFCND